MKQLSPELLIDLNLIRENTLKLKNLTTNNSKFMAILKSDAYGHNIKKVSKAIDDIVDGYGVVKLEEAKKLREVSDKKILLMQGIYNEDDLLNLQKYNINTVIHNEYQLEIHKKLNEFSGVWFKINTGMNRLGFELDEFLKIISSNPKIKKFTLMTHLAASKNKEEKLNTEQFDLLKKAKENLRIDVQVSAVNTGGLINFPNYHYDWVRAGIGIYGGFSGNLDLKTAMTLRGRVINIRDIKKGDRVGYDGRAVAKKDLKIATIFIGYADGLPQNLRDGTKVLINNKIAEIFGKISMDLTTIDISKAGKCQIGDWCEFFSPKLSINLISDKNSLIPYELMTKITPRVKRKFINDNS